VGRAPAGQAIAQDPALGAGLDRSSGDVCLWPILSQGHFFVPIACLVLELDVFRRARQPLFGGGSLRGLAGFVMGGVAFREHIPGFVGPSAVVLDDPVMNIAITSLLGASTRANILRREAVPD
jgi:hypothetical protein